MSDCTCIDKQPNVMHTIDCPLWPAQVEREQAVHLMMTTEHRPPVPKYKLTIEIEGNSLAEVWKDLDSEAMNAQYHVGRRDSCEIIGGRRTLRLEHANPEQTPEKYDAELKAWAEARWVARQ